MMGTAPKLARKARKVYVIGVGMTKVSLLIGKLRLIVNF